MTLVSANIPVTPSHPSKTLEPGSHSMPWPPDLPSSAVILIHVGYPSNTPVSQALDLCICTDLLPSTSITHFWDNTLEVFNTRDCHFSIIANSSTPLADLCSFPFSLLVLLSQLWLSFDLIRTTDLSNFPVAQFAPFLCLLTWDFSHKLNCWAAV